MYTVCRIFEYNTLVIRKYILYFENRLYKANFNNLIVYTILLYYYIELLKLEV